MQEGEIVFFCKTECPKCSLVKAELDKLQFAYRLKNVETDSEALAELMMNNILNVPVLRIGETFFEAEDLPKILEIFGGDCVEYPPDILVQVDYEKNISDIG